MLDRLCPNFIVTPLAVILPDEVDRATITLQFWVHNKVHVNSELELGTQSLG